jgi:type III secretion protein V
MFPMKLKTFARPEVLIVVLMVMLIGMLIVPLPTWLIDTLIATNIAIAAMIFVGSFYLTSITSFSSFPSVLLLTTVFRLALSITTTRMILSQADAGRIVAGFGDFVLGGDLTIGIIVFIIVTIVQFLVITKGAERVAEVCGRFSLDGLPGKQMSIDGDLRANTINGEQARARRAELERESQLYGSLDGAVKFVKNDALASILIIFVNFVGGISIGMSRHGMSFDEALDVYTILTVGDGMVAQIPALLISVAAGFIVTRVNGDADNLGTTIFSQLGGNTKVLLTVAVLLGLIGFLPGFPLIVFATLALLILGVCVQRIGGPKALVRLLRSGSPAAEADPATADGVGEAGAAVADLMPETVALALLLPESAKQWVADTHISDLIEREIFLKLGVKIPALAIRTNAAVAADTAAVLVNEVHGGDIPVAFGRHKVIQGVDNLMASDIPLLDLSQAGDASHWISAADLAKLPAGLDVHTLTDIEELAQRFSSIAARHIAEFFGIQETRNLLDQLEKKYPELVKETIRNAPLQRIANVLQRLVVERVSIRNLKTVLESLTQWAPKERDNIMLVEHVRASLGRYITEKFSRGRQLQVLVLSPPYEESVRRGIQQSANGSFLNMGPGEGERLTDQLGLCMSGLYVPQEEVVVLTSADIRRFVKFVIQNQFPKLDVISYEEVTDQSRINVLRTI